MRRQTYPQPEAYQLPVSQLLSVGDARKLRKWPDYPATYNLTVAHVPDLVHMMQDEGLNWADSDSDEVWAPIHAWRTLGQLRAESAIDAIMDTFYTIDDWDLDWQMEEYPTILAMIGPAAIPALKAYLADNQNGVWSRVTAQTAVGKIGNQYAQSRDECVAILATQLLNHEQQDSSLNAFLIGSLMDLNAIETSDIMEDAFNAGNVDLSVQGDWEEVQIELGLLKQRITPVPEYGWIPKEHIPLAKMVRSGRLSNLLSDDAQPDIQKKVGRNDPCPCGSGKKYKKCHGKPGSRKV